MKKSPIILSFLLLATCDEPSTGQAQSRQSVITLKSFENGLSILRGNRNGIWHYNRNGAILANGKRLNINDTIGRDFEGIDIFPSPTTRYSAIIVREGHGFHSFRLYDHNTGKVIFDAKKPGPLQYNPVAAAWSSNETSLFVYEAYEGQGFFLYDMREGVIVAEDFLSGRGEDPSGECVTDTSWDFHGIVNFRPSLKIIVDEYKTGDGCYSNQEKPLARLMLSYNFKQDQKHPDISRLGRVPQKAKDND